MCIANLGFEFARNLVSRFNNFYELELIENFWALLVATFPLL